MSNFEERFDAQHAKQRTKPAHASKIGLATKQFCNINRKELKTLIQRAINTMEPQNQPVWAIALCDVLESDSNDVVTIECY